MGKSKKKPATISGPPPVSNTPVTTETKSPSSSHKDAEAIFHAADCSNGSSDGYLTKSELKNYIKAHPALKQQLGIGSWQTFFEAIDTDGDGRFSMDEWVNFYLGACSQAGDADEGQCNPREAQLSAVYRALDGGDGVGEAILMQLGKLSHARTGKSGEWSVEQHEKLVARIGMQEGSVSESNFVWYFNKSLPKSAEEFDAIITEFHQVAQDSTAGDQEVAEITAAEEPADEQSTKDEPADEEPAEEQHVDVTNITGHLAEDSEELDSPSCLHPVVSLDPDSQPRAAAALPMTAQHVLSPANAEYMTPPMHGAISSEQGPSPETFTPRTAAAVDVNSFINALEQKAQEGEREKLKEISKMLSPEERQQNQSISPRGVSSASHMLSPQELQGESKWEAERRQMQSELDAALQQLETTKAKLGLAEQEVGVQTRKIVELEDEQSEMMAEKESLVLDLEAKTQQVQSAQGDAEAFTQALEAIELQKEMAISESNGLAQRCEVLEKDMQKLQKEHTMREEHTRIKYEALQEENQQLRCEMDACIKDATSAQDSEHRAATAKQREWEDERARLIDANSAASVALKELVDERRQMAHQISELKKQLKTSAEALHKEAAEHDRRVEQLQLKMQADLEAKDKEVFEVKQKAEIMMNERYVSLQTKLNAANSRAEAATHKQLDLQEEKRRLQKQLQQVKAGQDQRYAFGSSQGGMGLGHGPGMDAVVSMMSGGVSRANHEIMQLRMQLVSEEQARRAAQEGLQRAEAQLAQNMRALSSLGTPEMRGSGVRNVSSLSQGQLDAMMEANMPAAPRQVRTIQREHSEPDAMSCHSWGEEVALECVSSPYNN